MIPKLKNTIVFELSFIVMRWIQLKFVVFEDYEISFVLSVKSIGNSPVARWRRKIVHSETNSNFREVRDTLITEFGNWRLYNSLQKWWRWFHVVWCVDVKFYFNNYYRGAIWNWWFCANDYRKVHIQFRGRKLILESWDPAFSSWTQVSWIRFIFYVWQFLLLVSNEIWPRI